MTAAGISQDTFMRLNLQMILDETEELWQGCRAYREGETPSLQGCLLYCGQKTLQEDILYFVPESEGDSFPKDRYCYITNGSVRGNAPHIREIPMEFGELFNQVICVFQRYQQFQQQLAGVIGRGGSLVELLRVGSEFLQNPMYVHDSMFAILAESNHVEGMIKFEYNEKTRKMHIPLWLINEFKFDEAYRKTLQMHRAGIWDTDQYPRNIRSLFVNLWDGDRYLGRLLINELGTALLPGQYTTAEFLASYVILWLRSQDRNQFRREYNFEDTLIELITTGQADQRDLRALLTILEWKDNDSYLCMRLQSQNIGDEIRADSALNSQLASLIAGCVTFRYQQQLCVVINLRQSGLSGRILRTQLAPLVRDSYMYAGLSSPVDGIQSLRYGFLQSNIALEYITKVDSSNWLRSFSSCGLEYIRECACRDLPAWMVVHPVLLELRERDRTAGSQYYETLRIYLLCERSIPHTADALIIHRTTLTYRLNKIQELTRLNLEDPDLRLYLLLSYRFLEWELPAGTKE